MIEVRFQLIHELNTEILLYCLQILNGHEIHSYDGLMEMMSIHMHQQCQLII